MVKRKIAILVLLPLLGACSYKGPHKPVSLAPKKDDKGAGGSIVSYSEVQPLFAKYCKNCHQWDKDEAAISERAKKGIVQLRVGNKSMPQPGSPEAAAITQDDRDKIIAWADGVKAGGSAATVLASPAETVKDNHLALADRCISCHGPQGTSSSPQFPNLAAHDPGYIVNRLLEFMQPEAVGTIMPGQMQVIANEYGLKDAEDPATMEILKTVAAHFSTYDLSVSAQDMAKKREGLSPEKLALYETGKKIVAESSCNACHLPENLRPAENTPMIFAQKEGYLLTRLAAFKKMTSETNPMPGVLSPIADSDLEAIALYLSLTHPSEAQ